jgi:hypothetical protein
MDPVADLGVSQDSKPCVPWGEAVGVSILLTGCEDSGGALHPVWWPGCVSTFPGLLGALLHAGHLVRLMSLCRRGLGGGLGCLVSLGGLTRDFMVGWRRDTLLHGVDD